MLKAPIHSGWQWFQQLNYSANVVQQLIDEISYLLWNNSTCVTYSKYLATTDVVNE